MSDSEIFYFIYHYFVYKAILTNNSSKCSYLQVLKTYIIRIGLLKKMVNLKVNEHVIQASFL